MIHSEGGVMQRAFLRAEDHMWRAADRTGGERKESEGRGAEGRR